mmetsp:Transcript_29238/g.53594  ORF Transcript_29238/g.53594 Transcript_29238/m.53594 type:complete len:300 (+) Transcript_29238:22-921(+)
MPAHTRSTTVAIMTGLRKKSSNGPNPEVDVEAPEITTKVRIDPPAPKSSDSMYGHHTRPWSSFSFSNICEGTFSCLLGVFLGIIIIIGLICLDHREAIHLKSAHHIRDVNLKLLGDSNTRAYAEEILNVKFMMTDEYESQREEIKEAVETIAANHEKMKSATGMLVANGEEMPGRAKQFLALVGDPRLELDKFCGACPWDSIATCDQRVQYLQDKKNMKLILAKASVIMESPTCKQTEEYNALMNNPLLGLDKFCGTCLWDEKMTCDGRVAFLQNSRNIGMLQARISAMEITSCKIHKT